jgi:hypothetical protein
MYVDAGKFAQEATKKLASIVGATLVLMPQPNISLKGASFSCEWRNSIRGDGPGTNV